MKTQPRMTARAVAYHDIEQPPRQGGGLEVRGYLARSRIEEIGEGLHRQQIGRDHQEQC